MTIIVSFNEENNNTSVKLLSELDKAKSEVEVSKHSLEMPEAAAVIMYHVQGEELATPSSVS